MALMQSKPPPAPLTLRPSPLLRLYGAWAMFVGIAWVAIGLLEPEAVGGGLSQAWGGAAMFAYGVRVIRARVVARPDEVRVYNRLRNYRVERTELRAVELRPVRRTLWQMLRLPRPNRNAGALILTSGRLILMYATERADYGVPEGYFGPPRNAGQVAELCRYLGMVAPEPAKDRPRRPEAAHAHPLDDQAMAARVNSNAFSSDHLNPPPGS